MRTQVFIRVPGNPSAGFAAAQTWFPANPSVHTPPAARPDSVLQLAR